MTGGTEWLGIRAFYVITTTFLASQFPSQVLVSGSVDFVLAFIVLLGMMLFFGLAPIVNIIWLPFLVLLAFVTALGAGLWFSALNVQFRVRHTVPFVPQF